VREKKFSTVILENWW